MKPLLLLHGAIGAETQLMPLAELLSAHYKVYTFNFTGHGGKPYAAGFSIASFANEVLDYMAENNLEKPLIFGYSMGGYVAMYLAKHHPEKVEKLATLATKFYWDSETAAKEVKMLNPDAITKKLPKFAETLQNRHHPEDWKVLLGKTAEMMLKMGENNPLSQEDYGHISTPSLVLLGDRDKMVGLDETVNVYKALPNGYFGVLPGTPHPIEQVDVLALSLVLKSFFG
jgi:pimeloyl-ACP methyl ester carboxylesterase